MFFSFCFIAGESINAHTMKAHEDVIFHIRILFFQFLQKLFDFKSFAFTGIPGGFFSKAAGALNKGKSVVILPGNNIFLMNALHWTYQFHTAEIL